MKTRFMLTTGETIAVPQTMRGESWDWRGDARLSDLDMREAADGTDTIICTSARADDIARTIRALYDDQSRIPAHDDADLCGQLWAAFSEAESLADYRARAAAIKSAELCAIRRRLGLTQEQMASRLGVTANTVARQERAEVAVTEPIIRLARALELSWMRVAVYAQHTARAGQRADSDYEEGTRKSDDVVVYAGTAADMLSEAEILELTASSRGAGGDLYARRVARTLREAVS